MPTYLLTGVRCRATSLAKNWGLLYSTFHVGRPETLIEWKFESITYLPTDGRTDGQTWVGARDACASKKNGEILPFDIVLHCVSCMLLCILPRQKLF